MIVAFIDPQVAKVFIAVDKEWARVLPGYLNIGIEGHDQIAQGHERALKRLRLIQVVVAQLLLHREDLNDLQIAGLNPAIGAIYQLNFFPAFVAVEYPYP